MSFEFAGNPHINMASDIGNLAGDLDHYKNDLPLPLRITAADLVRDMHKFAQVLAGDAVDALYAPEEELHL